MFEKFSTASSIPGGKEDILVDSKNDYSKKKIFKLALIISAVVLAIIAVIIIFIIFLSTEVDKGGNYITSTYNVPANNREVQLFGGSC